MEPFRSQGLHGVVTASEQENQTGGMCGPKSAGGEQEA